MIMTQQTKLLLVSVAALVVLTFISYAYFFVEIVVFLRVELPSFQISPTYLGLLNAGYTLVAYTLVGLLWLRIARKIGYPEMYREGVTAKELVRDPIIIGIILGLVLVFFDWIFYTFANSIRLPHPTFPFSLIASASAAIGEEIFFRGLILALWAWVLHQLAPGQGKDRIFWFANILAALAFAAGHLPFAVTVLGVENILAVPPVIIFEIFLLNGVVGLVAGRQYYKHGLLAAIAVHFWTNVVWHVVWGLI